MTQQVIYTTSPEDFSYVKVNIPCQWACPALTNIPAYIRALFEENYDESYRINQMANIFPGVLGRICSRPCEIKCRHGEPELGDPVNICHIKRAAADFRGPFPLEPPLSLPTTDKEVAIVGAGPAGLAAAHDLRLMGIRPRLFEALEEPGGMLRYGIPEFRLPRPVLNAEIENILGAGISLETGVKIGEDLPLEKLFADFDAVLMATGCYDPISLDVPGEGLPGVYPGLRFMMDVCSGNPPEVGKRVLVVGAGFTAFDCARCALRLGSDEVTICLRRTEQDLAVSREEVVEAKREGIRIQSLMLAREITGNGRVEGVSFVRSRLGPPKSEGRPGIFPIEGSEFRIPADTVIVAVGQKPQPLNSPGEKEEAEFLKADARTYRSSREGLYVAGDSLTGPSTVIEAVAAGRRAAERIAEDLTGTIPRRRCVRLEEAEITDRKRVWDFLPREGMPTVEPFQDRFKDIGIEVETGLSQEQAKEEAKRCYLCYLHYEIDMERCIYCRYCMDVAPRDCIKLVEEMKTHPDGAVTEFVETTSWRKVNAVVIDNSRCIRCGECLRVCPVDCISVTRVELVERMRQARG